LKTGRNRYSYFKPKFVKSDKSVYKKSVAFLYTKKEQIDKGYMKAFLFKIASKIPRNKHNNGSGRPLK
jgi:hypothetical protein